MLRIAYKDVPDNFVIKRLIELRSQGTTFAVSFFSDVGLVPQFINWNNDACTDFATGTKCDHLRL